MKTQILRNTLLASAVIAAASLAGCGGGSTPTGTLAVSMTDAPACGFDAVNVTVQKVRVHTSATASDSDAGWTDITLNPAKKINLLNLTNGALEALGETPLDVGHYTQLRLVLDGNTGAGMANTVIASGTTVESSLETPSSVVSGIKLVNQFDVKSGERVDLVLDFDACKSILNKGNGKYALKPVVKVIPTLMNGINGFISPALLSSNVSVSAQQNGVVVSATTPNATTGEFYLARLAPGNYDVAITADNHAATVISAVPVATTTSTTAVSTSAAPLSLATSAVSAISGTVTMAPVSTTEAAYVSAKQTFSAGPTVTIKYQGADLVTGAYTLSQLPTAAPQYAVYSATLPLVFAANTTTTPGTGKYLVEAKASGYAVQSNTQVDVSLTAQSNVNFSLVP